MVKSSGANYMVSHHPWRGTEGRKLTLLWGKTSILKDALQAVLVCILQLIHNLNIDTEKYRESVAAY